MSTMRLLTKVAPLAIALAVFLFGTQLTAQTTYTWTGGGSTNNWTESANWGVGSGYPGSAAGDNAIFSGSAKFALVDAAISIDVLTISDDQDITLDANQLTVGTLTMTGASRLEFTTTANYTDAVEINTAATLASGCRIEVDPTSVRTPVRIDLNGTLSMASLNDTYIGTDTYTTIGTGNQSFITSDVVFMGTLDINGQDIPLGTNNVYFGPDPGGQLLGYQPDVTLSNGKGAFVTNDGLCGYSYGRIHKGYTPSSAALDQPFLYPLKTPTLTRVTHLQMKINDVCTNVNAIDVTTVPFANISVRLVYTPSGQQGGHPGAESGYPTVLFHWPVRGNGMPEESFIDHDSDPNTPPIPDPNEPGTSIDGYMAFHNNYRNGSTNLFSAIYKLSLEEQCEANGGQLPPDPTISGVWDLRGSLFSPITTGVLRVIPFGKYAGDLGGAISPSIDSTSKGCMYAFGDLSCGTGAGRIVPVELTSFSGRYYDDNRVQLSWMTATEVNNLGFWVERSLDGERWETLPDFVQGSGNSNVPLSYSFTDRLDDRLAQAPKIAYRLRQVDRDGTIDYSSIVYVYTGSHPETVELYKAYPNPFNPGTTLSFSLEESANVTLRVYSTLGMEVATLLDNRSMDAGFHNIEFNGNDLMSGVYIAVLEAAGTVQQQKLVLSK